jgi:hypothetical protein
VAGGAVSELSVPGTGILGLSADIDAEATKATHKARATEAKAGLDKAGAAASEAIAEIQAASKEGLANAGAAAANVKAAAWGAIDALKNSCGGVSETSGASAAEAGATENEETEEVDAAATQVRKPPSWPRSWTNFSRLLLYSHSDAWANLHLFGDKLTPFSLQVLGADGVGETTDAAAAAVAMEAAAAAAAEAAYRAAVRRSEVETASVWRPPPGPLLSDGSTSHRR